jgi:hypothetical protein
VPAAPRERHASEELSAMPAPARPAARAPARGGTGARAAPQGPRGARGRAPTEVEAPGGAAVKVGGDPDKDPRFRKVIEQLEKSADKVKRHPPASKKAAEAQAAAVPPANAQMAGAKANQVDSMQEAEAPKAEPDSFLALLREEIEKVMPRNLDEADKFMEGGEKDQIKGAVSQGVQQQEDAAAGPTQQATSAAPDPSGVPQKEVAPLAEEPAVAPPPVNAAEAMPAPKPAAEVNALAQAKQEANQQLEDAEVTPDQLRKANDPRFSAVLTAKGKVEKVADAAPGRYRASEQASLGQAAAKASGDAKAGLSSMAGVRQGSSAKVKSGQQAAKARDEKRRKEVADRIEGIYARTKQRVEAKLSALEPEVLRMFDVGAEAALADMRSYADREIARFKEERYAGLEGKARWVADLFRPVPEGIKRILEQSRKRFATTMDKLAVRIARTVDTRIQEAKDEISKGQAEIKAYVDGLPRDLQAVGRAAEQEVAGRFEELRNGIEEKKRGLAQKLAQKYKEAHDKADAALKKLEEENQGALKGLADALGAVIKALTEFKEKLMAALRKGWDTIKRILADPIGFLSNLIAAIKQGISQFVDNIWAHLKAGFMAWLFGSLAEAGIPIPSDLSLPSILKLVLAVLGITYERMRAKAVKLLGERAVGMLEKLGQLVYTLVTQGPAAMWEQLKAYIGDLKAMVIDALQSWLIETVIKAAVTRLLSLFNPAGAIVQAILAIYNTVMFFIERAAQIAALIEAIVNSVSAIASGAIGGAAKWIEQALARAIPVVIGFLARLLGLGNISKKIREVIEKVQSVVDRAIDKVLEKIVQVVKRLFGKGRGAAGRPGEEKGDFKQRAKAELAGRLKGEMEPGQLRSIVNGVYNTYAPEGLKGVVVTPLSGKRSEFEVFLIASKEKASAVEGKLGLDVSDLDLAWPRTALNGYLDAGPGEKKTPFETFRNAKGLHAEENLLAFLKSNWVDISLKRPKSNLLFIRITRSPCGKAPNAHDCAGKLSRFLGSKNNAEYSLEMSLQILSLYGGPYRKATKEALRKLADKGVQLSVWDVIDELGGEASEVRPEVIEDLKKRIAKMNQRLEDMKAIKAGAGSA